MEKDNGVTTSVLGIQEEANLTSSGDLACVACDKKTNEGEMGIMRRKTLHVNGRYLQSSREKSFLKKRPFAEM